MKILVDIGHPAHVHLFKNFAWEMQKKGHKILFTCRDKEFEIHLLKTYKFDYVSFGNKYNSIIGKIKGLFVFNYRMLKVALKFKPDLLLSHGSMYAAHVSFLIRKPHISLEDSENIEQIRIYKPFTRIILTPDCIPQKYGKKQKRYNGFHQSAYLHPNYFKIDENYKNKIGISRGDKVFLLRLVALNATHDISLKNIDLNSIYSLIEILKEKGKLYISSEKPLPKELEHFRLKIPPAKIHSFLSICDMVIGESGAMTNEAAYLGIPNVLVVDADLNVHKKYCELGLKFHFHEINDEFFGKIEEILKNIEYVKKDFKVRSKKYINHSIDLTEYIIEIVESFEIKQ